MKKAFYLAELITNAYPERMRLLYQANGINAPVSAKSFMDAYLVLGQPFLMSVFDIIWDGMKATNFSGIDGIQLSAPIDTKTLATSSASTTTTLDQAKTKTSFWDGLSNTFNTAGNILGTVVGAYDSVSGIFGGNKVNTGSSSSAEAQAALQAQMYQMQLQQQQAQQESQTKTWILVGVGVLALALIAIMLIKKK